MPKYIRYYLIVLIAVLLFFLGLGSGLWWRSREVAQVGRDLQAAEDRAGDLAGELERAESEQRLLEESLSRARGDLAAAVGRAGELADQLERERAELSRLENSIAASEGAAGRINDLIGEGESIIESLLQEENP